MQTKWFGALAASLLIASGGRAVAAAPPDMEPVPLTLSGCVVSGDAKDTYLLTNVVLDGTTLAPSNAFYRFNTTDGLKKHVGRRVEVTGKADLDDVDKGKVRVRTDDGKVTTEVTSERRTVKAKDAWFGSPGAIQLDAEVATYEFTVDSVKPIAGNCAGAPAAR